MHQPEDAHKFSAKSVEYLKAMGDYVFFNPLASVPWGGRSHVLGRRFILQKYLSNEDILQAYWVQEQQKRLDPQWRWKEPGLSHLTMLMNERSGHRWMQEMDEFERTTPTLMDYMEAEWGDATREAIATQHATAVASRRASFHLVPSE